MRVGKIEISWKFFLIDLISLSNLVASGGQWYQKFQLTPQSLREILEVAQSYINSFTSEVSRNGLLITKVGSRNRRVYRDEEVVDLSVVD